MTRIIAVLGMIALCACSGPGPEPTRAAAETALARGQLAEVDRYVAQGLALTAAEPQSVWAWRFRLLGVDAQISRLAIADAEKALAAPVPAGADFAVIRGRQKFLLARVQVLQGKLKEAAATLERGGHGRGLRSRAAVRHRDPLQPDPVPNRPVVHGRVGPAHADPAGRSRRVSTPSGAGAQQPWHGLRRPRPVRRSAPVVRAHHRLQLARRHHDLRPGAEQRRHLLRAPRTVRPRGGIAAEGDRPSQGRASARLLTGSWRARQHLPAAGRRVARRRVPEAGLRRRGRRRPRQRRRALGT